MGGLHARRYQSRSKEQEFWENRTGRGVRNNKAKQVPLTTKSNKLYLKKSCDVRQVVSSGIMPVEHVTPSDNVSRDTSCHKYNT